MAQETSSSDQKTLESSAEPELTRTESHTRHPLLLLRIQIAMDLWQIAHTFTEEAEKKSQLFPNEVAKRSQELTQGASRLLSSELEAEATKKSTELAAEAMKNANLLSALVQIRITSFGSGCQFTGCKFWTYCSWSMLIHFVSKSFWAVTSIGSLMVFNSCRNFHIRTHLCANTDGKIVLEASCGLVLDWILLTLNWSSWSKFPHNNHFNSLKPSYNWKPKPLLPIKFPTIKPCTGRLFLFSFLSRELKRVSNCC
jgi:hypothetical protein